MNEKIRSKYIINFSKKLGIYDNPNELLSISLGSAETTLLKLTSAYSSFINGGKLVRPILIDRIQDSEGKTILNNENRKCDQCSQISYLSDKYPKIIDDFEQIFSPETAYQVTSMLEGAVQRGTGKGLRDLNLDIAGKTGTTNDNQDAWFIGYSSEFTVGVFVGFDVPKSLGKFETGSNVAAPIFEEFFQKIYDDNKPKPFNIPQSIINCSC